MVQAMNSKIGENISKEWDQDPFSSELWDAINQSRENWDLGSRELVNLSERGSCLSMVFLGDFLMHGRHGAPKNPAEGEAWLRKSIENGSIEGAYLLARELYNRKDYLNSKNLFIDLDKRNYAPATFRLGLMSYFGAGSPRDCKSALIYFERGSKMGHLHAEHWLAYLLRNEDLGLRSWMRGILMRVRLIYRIFSSNMANPSTDRLRR